MKIVNEQKLAIYPPAKLFTVQVVNHLWINLGILITDYIHKKPQKKKKKKKLQTTIKISQT
jgi:succinate dehydrogenase hydrophobic anchor subunit